MSRRRRGAAVAVCGAAMLGAAAAGELAPDGSGGMAPMFSPAHVRRACAACVAGCASACSSACLLNDSVRVVRGIPSLEAELASSARITPHEIFMVRRRAICVGTNVVVV